ncbi:MAG: methyltransferase, partial [Vicinamibacterales bacterium]
MADHIAGGVRAVEPLAAATGTRPDQLARFLRYTAMLGLVEHGDGGLSLTPAGELLRSGSPDRSMRPVAQMFGLFAKAWTEVPHSLRTRESGYARAYGKPIFADLGERPEAAAIFDAAMTGIHGPETAAVLDAYDYGGIRVLADIGAGNGSVLIDTLTRHPHLRGLHCDLPHVGARARASLEAAGVADRCQVVPIDFFAAVPAGADAYTLRHIIHDWYDEDAVRILSNVRAVLPADGRVLVVEAVVPATAEPSPAVLFDIIMLIIPGGKERTVVEYAALYAAAGLWLHSVSPT